MHNPTEEHVRQLEHLVGYMRNFPHLKLIYHRGESAVADHLSHLSENIYGSDQFELKEVPWW